MNDLKFEKYSDGLMPAIVQDAQTGDVLMLGFMDRDALEATRSSGSVTFYSRSRQRLWKKGETSGNVLKVCEIVADCDQDTLLIKATPRGPACHTGQSTCFGELDTSGLSFLDRLERVIESRRTSAPEDSYVGSLFQSGTRRIAQKVGEEAVETVIAAIGNDNESLKQEAADLLFHLMILLQANGLRLADVSDVLGERHRADNPGLNPQTVGFGDTEPNV